MSHITSGQWIGLLICALFLAISVFAAFDLLLCTPHDIQTTTITVVGKSYTGGYGTYPIILDTNDKVWSVSQVPYMKMEINHTYQVRYLLESKNYGNILSAEEVTS